MMTERRRMLFAPIPQSILFATVHPGRCWRGASKSAFVPRDGRRVPSTLTDSLRENDLESAQRMADAHRLADGWTL